MVHFASPDEALNTAFREITETAQKTGHYPGRWSVDPEGDTRTVQVDRLGTQNWIESIAHTQNNFPGKVRYIVENANHRA